MEYAEKIPLEKIINIPGAGNASNAVIGASRLGLRSAIVSIVGKDESGETTIAHWEEEGVNTDLVQIDSKHPSNESVVLMFQDERTLLTHSEPRDYKLPRLPDTRWIYYTALGAGHEQLERDLLKHLDKHGDVQLLFNPGTTQLRRGLESLSPVIERSSVFIVNKEEAQKLLATEELNVGTLAHAFIRMGADIVVITDGSNGSYATNGGSAWTCPVFPVKAVERTGAGDSFATAFMVALHEGCDIPDALRYGSANSASVVQFVGPQAGLLTKKQMRASLKTFAKIKPKHL